jgi:hypothetical protein
MQNGDILTLLRDLKPEFTALLILAHQLGNKLEAVLDGLPAPSDNGIDPELSAGPLADAIWEQCGRHKSLVVRTRLTQRAFAEDSTRAAHANGRRRGRNGHSVARAI